MRVHVPGKIKLVEGEKLWESVKRLTVKYEKKSSPPVSLDTLQGKRIKFSRWGLKILKKQGR